MSFEVLPAIDVAGGRLVSVSRGQIHQVAAFGGSPLAAAEAFVEAGARWLHVVDVDRANRGNPDLDLLTDLARVDARVQASGGIESEAAARAALGAGATRVVLGSAVLADRARAEEMVAALGEAPVVGIEVDGERIRPRGAPSIDFPLASTLAWLRGTGATRYLYTGLSRVAGLAGPDLDGARHAAGALGRPVMVAGGVRSPEDVRAVRDLGPGVAEAVVVGRVLYEGVDLVAILAEAG